MAEQQIITNPSVTPGALKIELSGGYVTAISGHPVGGTGGGSPSVVYSGVEGEINVNNQQGTIGLADKVKEQLSSIPSAISSLPDANQYAKKADYYNKNVINDMMSYKQDKLLFGYDEDNAISSIDGHEIAGTGGVTGDYYSASNPSGFINSDQAEAQIIAKKYITSSVSELDNFYSKSQTSGANEIANAIKDFVTEDLLEVTSGELKDWVSTNYYNKTETSSKTEIENAFDNIPKYILNGDANITATSAQDGKNIRWDLAVNATPVVTDTTLTGDKGIYTHTTTNSGEWCVELVQSAYNAINDVQNKLDSTVAAQTYLDKTTYAADKATFLTKASADVDYAAKGDLDKYLTTAQYNTDSATFATKTDLNDYYKKTDTSSKTELSTEFAKYQVTGDYVTTGDLNTTSSTLTGVDNALSGYIDYVSGEIDKKVDKPTYVPGQDDDNKIYDAFAQEWKNAGDYLDEEMVMRLSDLGTQLKPNNGLSGEYDSSHYNFKFGLSSEYVNAIKSVSGKVDKPTVGNKILVYQTTGTTTSGWIEMPIDMDLSGRNFAVGVENEFVSNGGGTTDILLQGYQNSGTYVDFAQGYQNSAFQYGISQGYQNKANYESMAQGYINTAINIAFAQGSTNSANYQAFAQGILNKANYDSLAQGHSNSAVDQSIAQGLQNTAYHYSFAQGYNNIANNQSFAHGADNRASYYSQTIGHNLIASGFTKDGYDYGLFAIGGYNATTSNALFVVGNGSSYNGTVTRSDAFIVYPDGSVSAKGDISANGVKLGPGGGGSLTLPVNVGTGNDVSEISAIGAIGNNCSAGTKSFAFSYKGATAYENSFAVNDDNVAGHNSFAFGWGTTADNYSMAGGNNASADNHSFALAQGDSTAKSQAKNYSIAFGNAVTADRWSYVFGRGLNFSGNDDATTGIGALVAGGWNNTTANAIFVLGNGTGNGTARKDAMVVYRNGSVNIGNNTVNGSNFYVEGLNNLATSAGATSLGHGYTHIEGGYNTSNGGLYNHIEGESNTAYGDRVHIEGNRNIYSAGSYEWGVSVEGMANATTANVAAHDGILKVIGNGTRQKSGDTEIITRSDAYILYRDGTVKAKDFIAGGNTLSANYPVPKSVPNTADNNLQVQKMFVCTSDNDIIAHAALANGEGCIFFRVG